MPFRILKLFRPGRKTSDGLTQPQREAIADLLHYCMYADLALATAEETALDEVVAAFDWDSTESFASFEPRSIERARRANEARDAGETFLAAIAARLDTWDARQRALSVCLKLFQADGATSDPEKHAFAKIRAVLTGRTP